jgi:hypothetical protein
MGAVPVMQSIAGADDQIASPTQMVHPDEGFPPESKVAVLERQQDECPGFQSPVVLKAGLYFLEVDRGSQHR